MKSKTLSARKASAIAAQVAAMKAAAAAGDSFAAYWLGSVSASVVYHVQAGAVVEVKA